MSRIAVRRGVFLFVLVYLAAWVAGERALVLRTILLPAFALYALRQPDSAAFVRGWAPLLLGTVAYDLLRGATYSLVQEGILPVYAQYVISLERAVFGTPATPLLLQPFRTPALDVVGVALHASHFLMFLGFGIAVWKTRPPQFLEYRRAMLTVMAVGLIGYIVVPTVPPWLAALPPYALIPAIDHVIVDFYARYIPALYRTFDVNPVAAMPSLHAAFPVVCAYTAWRAFGGAIAIGLSAYAAAAGTAAVYLGEHYAVDVLAGVTLALAASWTATWQRRESSAAR